MKQLLILALTAILFTSCTQNERARSFGGTENVTLKPNEILINATWKELSLWILTVDTVTGVTYFRENSAVWGLWEGEIIIHDNNIPAKPKQELQLLDTLIKYQLHN